MMSAFFVDYGLFLAKTVTVVVAIAAVVMIFALAAQRRQGGRGDSLEVKKLNKKYDEMAMALKANVLHKAAFKKLLKQKKQGEKQKKGEEKKKKDDERKRIYVLNFHGDLRASAVSSLREEITAVLTVATDNDEVFVRLESGGGIVHAYGLAASQLARVRARNIPLTVAVDKVAASGGYMMACVANRILAAPFAIIGSIGVIAQVPNFHKVLKKHDIDYEQFTAGEFKRTVTLFGENTDEAKQKFHEEIEDIHVLFKDFIVRHRPSVDIEQVSTGESWPGTRALENQLVDELKTSDDYLLENSEHADIYEVTYVSRKPFIKRFGFMVQQLMDRLRYE